MNGRMDEIVIHTHIHKIEYYLAMKKMRESDHCDSIDGP